MSDAPKFGPDGHANDRPAFPSYSFLAQTAIEARAMSRRYWAKGGQADKQFPVLPVRYWKLKGDPPDEQRAAP